MRLLLLEQFPNRGPGLSRARLGTIIRDFLGGVAARRAVRPVRRRSRATRTITSAQVQGAFGQLGIGVKGLHAEADPVAAVRNAAVVVVGGGNTWKLLREVRTPGLLPLIRDRVIAGTPYIGWSAGSNLACPTIMTTNDMPICDPGGFDALGLVPFQINPHYLHGNPPGFKGETREERIREFGVLQPGIRVAGLREGTGLRIDDGSARLVGGGQCRVFRNGEEPREFHAGDDLDFLLAKA